MMKFDKIITIIEEIAPPHLTQDWDNSGVQVRVANDEINSVLVTLDITREVIEEAITKGVNLIISHHPLIFGGTNSIDCSDKETGEYINTLILNDVSAYSAHLTFDNAPTGNNSFLAEGLGLKNAMRVPGYPETVPVWIGNYDSPKKLGEFIDDVKKVLEIGDEEIRFVGDKEKEIVRVLICTGAGGECVVSGAKFCDVVLTGEAKYHEALAAKARAVALVEAGHHGTEKTFIKNFARQLREKVDGKISVIESEVDSNPYTRG